MATDDDNDNHHHDNNDHLPMCRNGYLLSLRGFSVSRAVLDAFRYRERKMQRGLRQQIWHDV